MSFADMITLLFALFMVLFAISSVNTSKFEALQKSLQEAFSGKILSGGEAIMETGNDKQPEKPGTEPPLPAMTPLQALAQQPRSSRPESKAAKKEDQDFKALKAQIDALVEKEGLTDKVETTVRARARRRAADRQRPLRLRPGRAQAGRPGPARQARRRARASRTSTRSSSRATPTTCRSQRRSTRPTGSCPARARRRRPHLRRQTASPRGRLSGALLRRRRPDREQRDARRALAQPPRRRDPHPPCIQEP